jgi:SAM-dependent methyltransferase
MEEIFYEIFNNLPRQEPGDVMITLDCFKKTTVLNKPKKVLDIGCGTGFQTVFMAINSNFQITAVDNYQPFVDELNKKAKSLGLSNSLNALNMDMFNLDFKDDKFDIILSEGSIYIITVEKGLTDWKNLLNKGSYLIFSDLCWVKPAPEGELTEFWSVEYPSMMSIDKMRKLISKCGYHLEYEKLLPSSSWVNNYYYPLAINVIKAREKYKENSDVIKIVDGMQNEIDLFYKYHQYFTYCFFVCKLI